LTKRGLQFKPAHFGFCCNVVMLPEIEENQRMLQNIHNALRKGGSALLVIPSLESILYSTWRLMEWNRREGVKPNRIPADDLSYYKGSKLELLQGIV